LKIAADPTPPRQVQAEGRRAACLSYLDIDMVVLEGGGDAAGAHGPVGHGGLGGVEGLHVDVHGKVTRSALGDIGGDTPIQNTFVYTRAIPGDHARGNRKHVELLKSALPLTLLGWGTYKGYGQTLRGCLLAAPLQYPGTRRGLHRCCCTQAAARFVQTGLTQTRRTHRGSKGRANTNSTEIVGRETKCFSVTRGRTGV